MDLNLYNRLNLEPPKLHSLKICISLIFLLLELAMFGQDVIQEPTKERFLNELVTVKVVGTGRTTGHIADISVFNPGQDNITVQLGLSDSGNTNGMIYVPSSKKHQGYIITGPGKVEIPAGGLIEIPLSGVCHDPSKPPIPANNPFPKPETWIFNDDLEGMPIPLIGLKEVKVKPGRPVIANTYMVPGLLIGEEKSPKVNPKKNPMVFATMVFDAVQKITTTTDILHDDGFYYTGILANDRRKTREIINQWTTWWYVGVLTGGEYDYKEFEKSLQNELSFNDLKVGKEDISTVGTQLWDLVQLTGAEAKVISVSSGDRSTSSRPIQPPPMHGIPEGCDTIRQKAHAWLDLNAKMICKDAGPLVDDLVKKFKELADKKHEIASLKGKMDAAQNFKSYLGDMKQSVMDNLQSEIDNLENMNSDDADCGGDWQAQMTSRHGSGARNQRRIRNMQRFFENRIKDRLRKLNDRKQKQEDYWNEKLEDLDSVIDDIQIELDEKEKEAEILEKEIDDILNSIKSILCDFNIQWEEMLRFMDANYRCLDCPQELLELPPIIIALNDCMSDIFRKLNGLKASIPVPDDQDLADAAAKAQFDPDDAKRLFDAVQEAIENYQKHINQGGGDAVNAVPIECKRLLQRASGYQFFGGVVRPQTGGRDNGRSYGTPGGLNVAGPADPGSLQDRQSRNEYRRQRREFGLEASRLSREINRAVRAAQRGHNGQPIENAFTDTDNIDAHGKAEAVKHQMKNKEDLEKLIDEFNKSLLECYNSQLQKQQQTRYVELITKCLIFRQCGLALATSWGEYRRLLDSLANDNAIRIADMEGRINNLERSVDQLERQIAQLEANLRDLRSQLNNLNDGLGSDARGAGNEIKNQLERRINDLNTQVRDLRSKRQNIRSKIADAKSKLNRAKSRSDAMSTPSQLRPISNAQDCKREAARISNFVNRANDTQDGPIAEGLGGAEADADAAADDLGTAFDDAGTIADEVRKLDGDIAGARDELEDLDAAIKAATDAKRRLNCERILAEYYNKNKDSDEPEIDIESIEEEIKNLQELLDQLDELRELVAGDNEKLEAILNGLKDKAGKAGKAVEEIKRIMELGERLATLWKGLSTDDPEAKARAFKEVLDIADELAQRVPGFGDMISYYAKAYDAAFRAIMDIRDRMIEPYLRDANRHINAFSCDNLIDRSSDKTADEIAEELWNSFINQYGESTIRAGLRSNSNFRKFKELFLASAIARVIECCIFR